jgi:hypothetical protein
MATVTIDPGICGLKTVITTSSDDEETVKVTIVSECPSIQAMQEDLAEVNGDAVCFSPFSKSPVYLSAEKHFKHAACPVPAGIVKAVEIACGYALPRDVIMKITK